MKSTFNHWRANFLTGLAIILPAAITLAIVRWLFGTISDFTDMLLVFLPAQWTHERGGEGPMRWYWSLFALALAVVLIAIIGRSARYYAGKKMIEMVDSALLRIPLLNKIYGTIKQVNQAFSSNQKTAFKQVVLVEFPRVGAYSVGFLTNEENPDLQAKTGQRLVSVFVPATPNPTSGFVILVPETEIIRLEMSVAHGIKYILSLGALAPEGAQPIPPASRWQPALQTPPAVR